MSAADRIVDARDVAIAKKANWFDAFTVLEESLSKIKGLALILSEMGVSKSPNSFNVDMLAYLGGQLWDHHKEAYEAFNALHALHVVKSAARSDA